MAYNYSYRGDHRRVHVVVHRSKKGRKKAVAVVSTPFAPTPIPVAPPPPAVASVAPYFPPMAPPPPPPQPFVLMPSGQIVAKSAVKTLLRDDPSIVQPPDIMSPGPPVGLPPNVQVYDPNTGVFAHTVIPPDTSPGPRRTDVAGDLSDDISSCTNCARAAARLFRYFRKG